MYLIWNRLRYLLSPQFDIYEAVARVVRGRVADVGSGTGFGTNLLTRNAKEVYAFDIDEGAIRFAKRVFPHPAIHFGYGDISAGIGGQYDYVVMIDVIEHIEDDEQAVSNARAMLGEGGMLILSTPNRLSRYRKAETHVREYSPAELAAKLGASFSSVNICNNRLEPAASKYDNPIIAVCEVR